MALTCKRICPKCGRGVVHRGLHSKYNCELAELEKRLCWKCGIEKRTKYHTAEEKHEAEKANSRREMKKWYSVNKEKHKKNLREYYQKNKNYWVIYRKKRKLKNNENSN